MVNTGLHISELIETWIGLSCFTAGKICLVNCALFYAGLGEKKKPCCYNPKHTNTHSLMLYYTEPDKMINIFFVSQVILNKKHHEGEVNIIYSLWKKVQPTLHILTAKPTKTSTISAEIIIFIVCEKMKNINS